MSVTILKEMLGKTIIEIRGNKQDNQLLFITNDECFKFWHRQDCCESVEIEDITGELEDLIGEPIIMAEVVSDNEEDFEDCSRTWTFYKFATRKGYVDIRWLGESNGYYSEEVNYANFPITQNLRIEKAEIDRSCTWDAAKLVAFSANIDGKTGWRLPTAAEWGTLYITNHELDRCWLAEPYQWMYGGTFEVECSANDKKFMCAVMLVRDLD